MSGLELIIILVWGGIMWIAIKKKYPSWSMSAFLLGGLWYLYHRMWLKGFVILAVQAVLVLTLGGAGILGAIFVGVYCSINGRKDLAYFQKEGKEDFSDLINRVKGATKKCPYCAEEIKAEAKICRYCGKEAPIGI